LKFSIKERFSHTQVSPLVGKKTLKSSSKGTDLRLGKLLGESGDHSPRSEVFQFEGGEMTLTDSSFAQSAPEVPESPKPTPDLAGQVKLCLEKTDLLLK
jgi:hypothetical protein